MDNMLVMTMTLTYYIVRLPIASMLVQVTKVSAEVVLIDT